MVGILVMIIILLLRRHSGGHRSSYAFPPLKYQAVQFTGSLIRLPWPIVVVVVVVIVCAMRGSERRVFFLIKILIKRE